MALSNAVSVFTGMKTGLPIFGLTVKIERQLPNTPIMVSTN